MESGMISVDKWSAGSQAYFLTHLHADHTAGLSAKWRRGPLFCSRLTAKLLPCKFPGIDLSLLRIVDIGSWHSLSLISPSSGSPTDFVFKAIDARHCPGAVMYLFRGDFGSMLFTGDFRWETNGKGSENARTVLLDALKDHTLDVLHLDNTYCNPRFSFPSREVATKQVVDIITSHPDHDVVIAIDSLGKEDLLIDISQALNIKIWVWPERLQFMHLLGFHQNFTTQTCLTRVRAIPRYSFSIETLEALNTLRPTIGIMASGLPWALEAKKGNISGCSASHLKKKEYISSLSGNSETVTKYHDYIFAVPYSDHSCFSEIQEFIELLRPVNMRGIVSSKSYCIDPCYYFDHLCGAEQAQWRVQRKLEKEESVDRVEASDIKPVAEGSSPVVGVGRKRKLDESSSPVVGRKRKLDEISFLGIRITRVSLLRRLCRGAKFTDTEP